MKILKILSKTTLLAFMAMAVVLLSCKSDDPEPEPVDNNPIVGKWQLIGIKTTAGADVPELPLIKGAASCIFDLKFDFTSNNRVTASDCPSAVVAMSTVVPVSTDTEWRIENTTLTLKNGSTEKSFPIVQAASEMKITVSIDLGAGASTGVMVFKRL